MTDNLLKGKKLTRKNLILVLELFTLIGFIYFVSAIEEISTVTLNSSLATNLTTENLTAYVNPLNSSQSYLYDWYKDGILSAVFLGNATSQNTLPSSFTTIGETWYVNATPKVLTNNYNISNASFVQNFSIAAQETTPYGIAFNNDGTKMFVSGLQNDNVSEYALSTAFNVSTASYTQGFYVGDQDGAILGVNFNNDGTKMFVIGDNNNNVSEYALSTGFDVSTASYTQGFDVSPKQATPVNIDFNGDGTKMFLIGLIPDNVTEYTLSTGFDVSTASFTQELDVSTPADQPHGIAFNSDGTKMFVLASGKLFEYDLSPAFDISTASLLQNLSVSGFQGVTFNNDGTKVYFVGTNSSGVVEYSIGGVESGTTVQSNNLTILSNEFPSVFDLIPFSNATSNQTFNISSVIEIAANVTDNVLVDTVYVNVTYPNGTVDQITLNNVSAITGNDTDKFNSSFVIPNMTGQYNITFIANDTSGNVNSTETTFFVGEDGTPPSVFDLIPVSNTNYNVSDVIEIAANVTDNILVDVVLANITYPNGTVNQLILSNVSVITGTDNDKFNVSFTIPSLTGTYNITFIANDTTNNLNSTKISNFTVNDVSAPDVTTLIPAVNSIFNVSNVIEIAANVSDDVLVDVVLANITYPNGTVNQLTLSNVSSTENGLNAKYNVSFTIPNATGVYNITIIANDTGNNINSTELSNFTVNDITNPDVTTLIPAVNSIFNVSNVIEIAANVSDDVLVDIVLANITYPNGTVNQLTLSNVSSAENGLDAKFNVSFTIPGLTGTYNITIIANDTSNNLNSTETSNFTVNDVAAPNVTTLIPAINSIFNVSNVIEIAVNVSDDVLVDVVLANITYPNGTVNQLTLSNVSSMENGLDAKFNVSFTIPALLGVYNITFIANDTSNNLNSSEMTNFTVNDVEGPNVTSLIPSINSVFNVSNVIEIAVNVSDDVLVDVVFANITYPNGTVSQLTLSNISSIEDGVDAKFNASFTIPAIIGTFNVTFIANDTSNNINSSETSNFTVNDIVNPDVTTLVPTINSIFNVSNVIEIATNVSDDVLVDVVLANITYPNGTVEQLTLSNVSSIENGVDAKYNASFTIPGLTGIYNITIIANDTSNNLNSTEASNFTVNDVAAPDVTTLIPAINSVFNVSNVIEIAANVSDDVFVDVVLVNITYPNGTVNQLTLSNVSSVENGLDAKYNASFTIPALIGVYNITIIANDTSNNLNSTEASNFTVNDITNPTFDEALTTQTIEAGVAFGYDINASDDVAVDDFSVNDSINFTINSTGYLSNNTILALGNYSLTITVNDTSNNTNSSTMIVSIIDLIFPTFGTVEDQESNYTVAFGYQISASDNDAISAYSVNDTTNFAINSTGYLSNNTVLTPKIYYLNVTINDSNGNENSTLLEVLVREAKAASVVANSSINLNYSWVDVNLTLYLAENVSVLVYIGDGTATAENTTASLTAVKGINITADSATEGNLTWALIRIYYNSTEISGLDESTLKIYYYNDTSGDWELESNQEVNTANNYVQANVTHFSVFGIFGSEESTTTTTTTTTTSSSGGSGGCSSKYESINGVCVKKVEEVGDVEENLTDIPEQLFDISFTLADTLIEDVYGLSALVTFESFGTTPTPIVLTFIILDRNGNEIYRTETTLTVTTEEVLRWNFGGLMELPEGKYTAVLQTLYDIDVFDEFKEEFEVKKKKGIITGFVTRNLGMGSVWIIGGIVLSILVAWTVWKLVERKKRTRVVNYFKWRKQQKGNLIGKGVEETKSINDSQKELNSISKKLKGR